MKNDFSNLEDQIKENRKLFRVDHFDMVIEDYVNRIDKKTLILNPPYQRLFRWDIETQSQLIESILIGIPIPPIFVFQNDDSIWEIIDGLQRTNTLYNFLKKTNDKDEDNQNNNSKEKKPIKFEGCTILTELNGLEFKSLPEKYQRTLKNTRIRIEIVEETEDILSQYLLFNRLNSNGEILEPQEIRNFLIYKTNNYFYSKLIELAKTETFLNCLNLKNERVKKQENVEFLLKFLLGREFALLEKQKNYKRLDDLITKESEIYLKKYDNIHLNKEFDIFIKTFDLIYSIFGKNAFRYYTPKSNSIANTFSMSVGLSFIIDSLENKDSDLIKDICCKYFNSDEYISYCKQSYSPTKRLFNLSKYSKKFFETEITK